MHRFRTTHRSRTAGRAFALSVVTLVLGAALAIAEPQLLVRYPNGVPQVSISGDYAGSAYTVWRAREGGAFERISENQVLCIGPCYAEDAGARAGETYLYRFDLLMPVGSAEAFVSFGPYRATISPALARPVGVFAYPNPGRGATTIQLHFAGLAAGEGVIGEAALFDLAGRRVRDIHRGALVQRLTTLTWDGRDQRGALLGAGVYLLRFSAGGRETALRLVRR